MSTPPVARIIQQQRWSSSIKNIHNVFLHPNDQNKVRSSSQNQQEGGATGEDNSSKNHNVGKKYQTILSYLVLCCVLGGGTMFFTSDTFLKWMIEATVSLAQKMTSEEEDEQWNLTFDSVSGCFFCGSVKFENFSLTKTMVEHDEEDDRFKQVVKLEFNAAQMIGVVAFDKIIKQAVKQWWNRNFSSVQDVTNTGKEEKDSVKDEHRGSLIYVPRLGIVGGNMNVRVDWIPKDMNASTISNNGKQRQTKRKTRKNREEGKFHVYFGDLRVYDSVCKVHLNSMSEKNEDVTVLKIHEYESLESFSTRDWLFNMAFRSIMKAELNGSSFSTNLIVSELEQNKDIITDYHVQWKLDRYPIDKLVSFETAFETARRQLNVPTNLASVLSSPFTDRYISLDVTNRETQASSSMPVEINMAFKMEIFNERKKQAEEEETENKKTTKPSEPMRMQFEIDVPKSAFEKRELDFLSLIAVNLLRRSITSSTTTLVKDFIQSVWTTNNTK